MSVAAPRPLAAASTGTQGHPQPVVTVQSRPPVNNAAHPAPVVPVPNRPAITNSANTNLPSVGNTDNIVCTDNKVNIWQILHNTPNSVVSLLQLVLATSFESINNIHSIKDIFKKCGGKCIRQTITDLSVVLTDADKRLQACKVRDNACITSVTAEASRLIDLGNAKNKECYTSVGVVVSTTDWQRVVLTFKNSINYAISSDAQLLNESSDQIVGVQKPLVPASSHPVVSATNVKQTVVVAPAKTPVQAPVQIPVVKPVIPSKPVQVQVPPRPAQTAGQTASNIVHTVSKTVPRR